MRCPARAAALVHRTAVSICSAALGGRLHSSQKYSVNPNGWLKGADSAACMRRQSRHANRIRRRKPRAARCPIHLVAKDALARGRARRGRAGLGRANGFTGEAGRVLVVPGAGWRALRGALFGLGKAMTSTARSASAPWRRRCRRATGISPTRLGRSDAGGASASSSAAIVFTRYGKKPGRRLRLALPEGADAARVERVAEAVFLARDLINTPTNDMGPDALEAAVRKLAAAHKAKVSVIDGRRAARSRISR